MPKLKVIVIGAGAAGLCSAISAARKGCAVLLCEKMSQPGKKLLATGNGRCNLLNENLENRYYNRSARELVESIFKRTNKTAILDFFKELGLTVYQKEGKYYPVTNQASSVLKVLDLELKRLQIEIEYGFDCVDIKAGRQCYEVTGRDGRRYSAPLLIVACGGKTYPAYGADGAMYAVLKKLGHSVVEPVPSAVPLLVKDNLCVSLQGQRISAAVKPVINGLAGQPVAGELLFTRYGLSGTAVLDISNPISVAMNRDKVKDAAIEIDWLPFISTENLKAELARRRSNNWAAADMLAGLLPNKISTVLRYVCETNSVDEAVRELKGFRMKVEGTRGWNEAEFTCGGINVQEVYLSSLESKLHQGLYLAGEVLDVDGVRGGFNLAWAWASGLVSGASAAEQAV
jgi:predicted Rossmann fold flavoprotein